jgi:transcriptional regulator with XRE-family HTH domain
MKEQMAQNVKDVQIDRLKALAKKRGITQKYLCDLIGKSKCFIGDVQRGMNHFDENELTIIAARLETTVDYLTGKTDEPGVSIQQRIDAAITAKEADELTALFERLSEEDRQKALTILRALAEAKRD